MSFDVSTSENAINFLKLPLTTVWQCQQTIQGNISFCYVIFLFSQKDAFIQEGNKGNKFYYAR